ncbi:MAG: type VI secretion system-associated lipoprotein [Desulfobacteraceae bacterium 4572_88]|nr:MAG: type VI secretion system-associated lipoprotein [Desulfobacteraceae bacterium 4572_88]
MKYCFRMICLLMFASMVFSCSSPHRPPIPQFPEWPEWPAQKEAIQLRLIAAPDAHLFEGKPHPLLICLYQLKDLNAFDQLADYEEGLSKLLDCDLFDASVLRVKRYHIQPGDTVKDALDRAKGVKHAAVVAGYRLRQRERMVRIFDIPMVEQGTGYTKIKKILRPDILYIDLEMGSHQIRSNN